MLSVALIEPQIPPNTGNIIRLCANTGARLHLVHPLGFELSDKRMRRAGLDYHEFASVQQHENWDSFVAETNNRRLIACSTRGTTVYSDIPYDASDMLLFGSETQGLGRERLEHEALYTTVRLPMRSGSRSLNLSNSVAIVVYEAWRQLGFS